MNVPAPWSADDLHTHREYAPKTTPPVFKNKEPGLLQYIRNVCLDKSVHFCI